MKIITQIKNQFKPSLSFWDWDFGGSFTSNDDFDITLDEINKRLNLWFWKINEKLEYLNRLWYKVYRNDVWVFRVKENSNNYPFSDEKRRILNQFRKWTEKYILSHLNIKDIDENDQKILSRIRKFIININTNLRDINNIYLNSEIENIIKSEIRSLKIEQREKKEEERKHKLRRNKFLKWMTIKNSKKLVLENIQRLTSFEINLINWKKILNKNIRTWFLVGSWIWIILNFIVFLLWLSTFSIFIFFGLPIIFIINYFLHFYKNNLIEDQKRRIKNLNELKEIQLNLYNFLNLGFKKEEYQKHFWISFETLYSRLLVLQDFNLKVEAELYRDNDSETLNQTFLEKNSFLVKSSKYESTEYKTLSYSDLEFKELQKSIFYRLARSDLDSSKEYNSLLSYRKKLDEKLKNTIKNPYLKNETEEILKQLDSYNLLESLKISNKNAKTQKEIESLFTDLENLDKLSNKIINNNLQSN